jgi:hypothetical protein
MAKRKSTKGQTTIYKNSYKPITNTAWVCARLCKLQKGCTRLAAASDKVYQLLAHGRWFSLDTPASSTNTTGRHDIAEILPKVALNTKKSQNIKPLPLSMILGNCRLHPG